MFDGRGFGLGTCGFWVLVLYFGCVVAISRTGVDFLIVKLVWVACTWWVLGFGVDGDVCCGFGFGGFGGLLWVRLCIGVCVG